MSNNEREVQNLVFSGIDIVKIFFAVNVFTLYTLIVFKGAE